MPKCSGSYAAMVQLDFSKNTNASLVAPEARPGSEVKYTATEAEGSHFGNATVHSMVAQQQYEVRK